MLTKLYVLIFFYCKIRVILLMENRWGRIAIVILLLVVLNPL